VKIIVYLNKWHAGLFHIILSASDGEIDYTLASRVATTEGEARRVVEEWQQQHAVDEVIDNTKVQLADMMAGLEPPDFSAANN
jgi:hypothetical protein